MRFWGHFFGVVLALVLSWDHDLIGVEGFRVYRADGSGFALVATVAAPALKWEDAAADPGKTYSYFVTAYSGGAESGPSNVVTVTVPPSSPGNTRAVIN